MPPLKSLGALALLFLTAACGVPPELTPDQRASPPTASPSASPALPPGYSPRPTGTPSATASPYPVFSAVPCGAKPSATEIASLVKQKASVTTGKALTGPLCAGTWHYTLFEVQGKEPVHVLTIATSSGLTLFAAGTDICTADVQQQAPYGVRVAASC